MKRFGNAALRLAFCAMLWHAFPPASEAEPPSSLPASRPPIAAVLPLANLTGDDALGWVGVGLQETLTWDLRHLPDLHILDLQDLVQRARRSAASLSGLTSNDLASLGGQLGVDIFLAGEYRGNSQQVVVNLIALDNARGSVLAARSFSGPLTQMVSQARQALLDMAQSFPIASPPKPAQQPLPSRPPTSSALAARANGIVAAAESLLGGGIEPLTRAMGWLRQAVRDDPTDGGAWFRLGESLVRAAEYEDARQTLSRALGIARAVGDRALEVATLNQIGDSYILQGRGADAEPYFAEALPLARQAHDWASQVIALQGIGSVYHIRGEHALAQSSLEGALQIARAIGNRGAEAKLLNHLGVLRIIRGEYAVARQHLGEAIALAQVVGDRNTERMGLNNFAVIAIREGAYREARVTLEKVLQITRTLGDRRGEANCLKLIGQVEALRGAYAAALPILQEALSLAQQIGTQLIEVEALEVTGTVHVSQGTYPEAQASFEKALAMARALKVPLIEGRMLHYLGQVSLARLALDDAQRYEEAALRIAQQIVDRRMEALSLHGLGEIELARGHDAESWRLLEGSDQIAERLGLSEILWQTRYGMGRILEVRGQGQAALARYRDAVSITSSLVRQFGEEEERQTFLANKLAVYDALARLLLKLHEQDSSKGYDREAWAVLEAKKGRVVGEALGAVRAKPADPQARAEADQAQAKQDQVLALEKSLRIEQAKAPAEQRPEKIQTLTTLLAQTKAEYLAQVKTFLARYPQYKSQFVDQYTVDPRNLAKFAGELPENTLAVQYFAAPDALYLFVVAPGGRFQVKRQAVTQADLYALIRQYRRYVERGASRPLTWADDGSEEYRRDVAPLKEVTRKLAAHLLAPIEAELQAYPNLILIPNDQLLFLPIHALTRPQPDGSERFLAETHALSYLTQQEVVSLFRAPRPSGSAPLLALANPDGSLPAASREVQELRRIRPAVTALDGPQATKERFLSLAGQFPDLHLATHGILDPQRPERSYLLMAGQDEDSQRLGIDEIAGLSLHGMAILSACETALGEQVPGAALITLAAAFSQAGAHAIVASLWKVNDAATRDFMVAFYRAQPVVGRAAALQQAQLAVLKNPLTANPHYWAPFILIGAR